MSVAQTDSVPCFNCGFPIAILSDSQEVKCPWCGEIGIITNAIDMKAVLAVISVLAITAVAIQQHYGK